ncbi:MAG TPA: thiamine pyrophosphate-dependent enzyme [Flavobacteriales bacterium]|nr:thiamine pyrophosphate-dependent enzyme [Flavobacteriales bacterium]
MNVCEALLDILADYNVKYIFGIPGDAINELIEAIRKQDKIKFIHVMHEESGAFAASAQAKLTGELAVCVGTAGPGGIHLLNGLYDAKMDHAPVLAITGQIETSLIGTAYQQEVNIQALFENVSVYNQTIYDAAQMPEVATLAIQAALSKRSVSHLSIPSNVAVLKVPEYKRQKQIIHSNVLIRPGEDELKKAAALINKAGKPCILAGIGAKHAVNELEQLAALIKAPIIKALRGKDILPDIHPYVIGGTGLLGTRPSLNATQRCDLFIVVGSDFPYHDFYPSAGVSTIQVDHEPHHIGRRHPVDAPLIGDTKITLTELLKLVDEKTDDSFLKNAQNDMKEWLAGQDKIELSADDPIHPQAAARAIGEQLSENAIIACDTGTITVWGARNLRLKNGQKFTLSGGLASMAFALPAAIGAKLSYPDRQVIALCGDGGFAMLMCDFATAVKYNLNIKIFVFNNSKLGLIQMEQEAAGNPEFQTSLHNPEYAEFAKNCGGDRFTIRTAAELNEGISKALASTKPTVVNVFVNPDELTWPPRVTMSQVLNYTKAKIKEFFA